MLTSPGTPFPKVLPGAEGNVGFRLEILVSLLFLLSSGCPCLTLSSSAPLYTQSECFVDAVCGWIRTVFQSSGCAWELRRRVSTITLDGRNELAFFPNLR